MSPPDLPRFLGWIMMCWAVVALLAVAGVAWHSGGGSGLMARFAPRVEVRVGADGVRELVIRRDRDRRGYVAPGTVNGLEVEFLVDTGATGVALPTELASRLGVELGMEVDIVTASEVVAGHLVMLDEVSLGPLTLRNVRGDVAERSAHDEVLLGLSFLRHFEVVQEADTLTLRVPSDRH